MTYKQAMRQKCDCGKRIVGGWIGYKGAGRPNFSRVSIPRMTDCGVAVCEEHTIGACYAPQRIHRGGE